MRATIRPYTEYQTTHLGWLTEIPAHWKVIRLKYLGEAIIGLTYSPDDVTDEEHGTLVLRSSNVQNRRLKYEDNVYVSKAIPSKLIVRKGDILICSRNGSRALIGKNAQIDEDAEGSSFGAFMSVFRSELNDYILQIFNSPVFEYQSGTFLTSTINQLTIGNLKSFEVPLPPREEQTQIAKFLDYETAKIDALIAKQQQLIVLLQEKRQAVISHAVTKGLNPAAPLRDSGVEWLGKVPAHWEATTLKYHARVIDCKHLTAEFVDEGVPLASIGEAKGWFVDLTTAKQTTEKFYDALIEGERDPRQGDIIFTRNATVGEASLVATDMPRFAIGQDVCLIRPAASVHSEFLLHCLKSPVVKNQLDLAMVGSTFKRINVDNIRNFAVTLPPADEQTVIVEHLNRKLHQYNKLISAAESAVTLLQERRTALISAAVTGKIDVRGWQPPLANQAGAIP